MTLFKKNYFGAKMHMEEEIAKHYLKRSSSFIVVILRSLRHKGCVCCNYPIHSFEESERHWREKLEEDADIIMVSRDDPKTSTVSRDDPKTSTVSRDDPKTSTGGRNED